MAFRLQNEENRNQMAKTAKDRDRALAMAKANDLGIPEPEADGDGDTNMEESEEAAADTAGSKVIVIHVGSQNLRIGLASDALPKTVPMVIAHKSTTNEAEDHGEPYPKRQKMDDGSELEPEKQFGPEVRHQHRASRNPKANQVPLSLVCITVYDHVCGVEDPYATEQAPDPAKLEGNGH